MIIFSIGNTNMPSAPNVLSCPMISQKRFSSSTVWILLQPSVAKGITVGLLIPGSTLMMSFTLSVGAFISTYFLSSAAFTASMRKSSSSSPLPPLEDYCSQVCYLNLQCRRYHLPNKCLEQSPPSPESHGCPFLFHSSA